MPNERTPDARLVLQAFDNGAGFSGFGLRDPSLHAEIDPLLSVDHFRMTGPTFAPHPHAGFSAVTYLFDDSTTGFLNRDSLGQSAHIGPGALHWTQAGTGIIHEESPRVPGRTAHGVQIFVNLPARLKREPPRVQHASAEHMPWQRMESGDVKLIFGHWGGQASPVEPPTRCALVEFRMQAWSAQRLFLPPGQNAVVLVVAGKAECPAPGGPVVLLPSMGALLRARAADGMLSLRTGASPCHGLLFLGEPLGEPVVVGGPFVMNTAAEITQARRDFQAGRMGWLEPSR